MRFLVDECTGPKVARFLEGLGHDVYSVYDLARGSEDEQLLRKAHEEGFILVTNDKDFGELVFRKKMGHRGIILLRLADEGPQNKIAVLERVLEQFGKRLENNFIVVTEKTIRIVEG